MRSKSQYGGKERNAISVGAWAETSVEDVVGRRHTFHYIARKIGVRGIGRYIYNILRLQGHKVHQTGSMVSNYTSLGKFLGGLATHSSATRVPVSYLE